MGPSIVQMSDTDTFVLFYRLVIQDYEDYFYIHEQCYALVYISKERENRTCAVHFWDTVINYPI